MKTVTPKSWRFQVNESIRPYPIPRTLNWGSTYLAAGPESETSDTALNVCNAKCESF